MAPIAHAHISPLPWRFDGPELWDCLIAANGKHVVCMGHDYDEGGVFASEADVRFIVECVNTHASLIAQRDALMAACKLAVDALREWDTTIDAERICLAELRAAIAKAEGY